MRFGGDVSTIDQTPENSKPTSPDERSRAIKSLARTLGADLVGVCEARATPESEAFGGWLERGYAGSMAYLERTASKRMNPAEVFEGARSMIVVGLVYDEQSAADSLPTSVCAPESQRSLVARYALGDDYHNVLGDRLHALAAGIEALLGREVVSRAYVDTGPVIERVAAAYAGLGWIGKNTCLIHEELGSYLFLGVLVTDLELASDELVGDLCGTCTACLDACPTDALEAPRLLNATRCIAYTTIEDPGPIPEALRSQHGDRVYGCDICQEVCPWNNRGARTWPEDPLGLHARLAARPQWVEPSLAWLLDLDESSWLQATRASAMRRSKWRGLMRNALVVAGNSGDPDLIPRLSKLAKGEDDMLAEHAIWAIRRLEEATGSA